MKPVWIGYLLVLNALIEGGAGLFLALFPGILGVLPGFEGVSATAYGPLMMVRLYGVAATMLGFYSFLLLRQKNNPPALSMGMVIFAVFHTATTVNQVWHNPQVEPAILHGLLALGFILGLFVIKN